MSRWIPKEKLNHSGNKKSEKKLKITSISLLQNTHIRYELFIVLHTLDLGWPLCPDPKIRTAETQQ